MINRCLPSGTPAVPPPNRLFHGAPPPLPAKGWTADEYEAGKGNNWGDRYDVGGTAVPDLIPYDSEEMADFVEEASIAEKERYRFLLLAALGGGVIQNAEKEKLELYREMHAIPDEEHNRLLFEQGWKPEEYEAGFHKDIASSHFQRYASLVKRELNKGKVSVEGGRAGSAGSIKLGFCWG